jgi:DNA-binding winged helix-turn-helix (wHTH) protein/tetratricopeptide (TPR) repeat protein
MLTGASGTSPRLVRDEPECITLSREQPFRIGDAEFSPATREVLFDGRTSIVEPRVMQLLVALHRANGAVVSKDDLTALCWERRVVGEDAINRVVSRLRAVAEKLAGGQFRIETITKVGYRLVPAKEAPKAVSLTAPNDQRLSRRAAILGGMAAAAAVGGGGGWVFLSRRDSMPPEARRLYTEARSPFFQNTPEQAANTIGKLRQAVQIAPNNADIWGLLGFAYVLLAAKSLPSERGELYARGYAAARRALSIDPGQPDALAAFIRGTAQYRNWDAYERKCREALRLHPDHDILNILFSDLLMNVGRLEEGLKYAEVASSAAPDVPSLYWQRCVMLWNLGRLDEADALLSRAFSLWPRNASVWLLRMYYLMYNGHAAEAAAMIANGADRPEGIPDWYNEALASQANSLVSNNASAVRATIKKWDTIAVRNPELSYRAAIFAGFNGDDDSAFRMLEVYYFSRRESALADSADHDRQTYFLFDRPIAGIRRDPRFGALTRRIGLSDYWARTNSRPLVAA